MSKINWFKKQKGCHAFPMFLYIQGNIMKMKCLNLFYKTENDIYKEIIKIEKDCNIKHSEWIGLSKDFITYYEMEILK